jgi:hypothetical protein
VSRPGFVDVRATLEEELVEKLRAVPIPVLLGKGPGGKPDGRSKGTDAERIRAAIKEALRSWDAQPNLTVYVAAGEGGR